MRKKKLSPLNVLFGFLNVYLTLVANTAEERSPCWKVENHVC